MAYREIDRDQPNTKQGDDARTWAGKTNENMKELFSRMFLLGDWMVTRWSYDPNTLSFGAFKDDDYIRGWANGAKTRWVEGVILDADGFSAPDDLADPTKFFITNERLKID